MMIDEASASAEQAKIDRWSNFAGMCATGIGLAGVALTATIGSLWARHLSENPPDDACGCVNYTVASQTQWLLVAGLMTTFAIIGLVGALISSTLKPHRRWLLRCLLRARTSLIVIFLSIALSFAIHLTDNAPDRHCGCSLGAVRKSLP